MVTLTVTKIDGKTRANWSTPFDSRFVRNLRPLDRTNISTDAVFEYEVAPNQYQTFQVSENCDTVAASFTADDQEQGAELQSNKATDFSVLNDVLYPTTDAVKDSFQPIWYAAATGTDTYAITLTGVVPTAYYAGMTIHATFANANSGGASTINVNALGAKAITKNISTALAANDIAVGKVYELKYDGTRFQIDAVDKEAIANKVTSISGASTDIQYPSAKLVYDTTQLLAPIDAPTFTGVPAAPTAASGTNTTQLATTAFVQNKKAPYGTASGTDTYAVTLAPVVTVAAGLLIVVRFTNASSGASTLNVAAGGAVAIVKKDGSTAIGAGDIAANTWYQLFHDGTSWVALGI